MTIYLFAGPNGSGKSLVKAYIKSFHSFNQHYRSAWRP